MREGGKIKQGVPANWSLVDTPNTGKGTQLLFTTFAFYYKLCAISLDFTTVCDNGLITLPWRQKKNEDQNSPQLGLSFKP